MKINEILKTKIPFSAALLIILAATVSTEQTFIQAIKENTQANDKAVIVNLWPTSSHNLNNARPSEVKEKVALTGASIPMMPGAKRLTFDDSYAVRYRVNASADLVANFYRQALASQGWKIAAGVTTAANLEGLTIAYAENPLSKKTDITYAYAPASGAKVLGVKIAEADATPPAPAPEQQPQQPNQPLSPPPDQNQPQPTPPGQNQPYPNQPMQPQGPNQPNTNQMDFSRQPMQPFPGGQQNGNQTCRINGAEMPGPCEQYNNQTPGQNNQGGQFNQGGPNQGGPNQGGQMDQPGQQQGPSEEDIKKMDEQRFKDMKRGISQFTNGAKMMKKNIARVKTAISKCGVGLPEELVNSLAQTDSLVEKINAAQTADQLDEIIGDIQDVGSVMQDWGPRMGDLSRLCQILKQADRDAKQFDRSIKQMESQAKANKKVDLSELFAEYKTNVTAQKDALAQAKELAKTDPDSALAMIEDDFYGNMDNLGNLQMQINTIFNISKGIKDITREISTFTSQIKTLTKKKVDTTSMQELLDTLKAQVAEIKDLIKGKVDPEELINKVDETFNTRQELQDALQEYDMIKTMPQVNDGSNYNVKMNLPDAFIKNENNNGGSAIEPSPANAGSAGTQF